MSDIDDNDIYKFTGQPAPNTKPKKKIRFLEEESDPEDEQRQQQDFKSRKRTSRSYASAEAQVEDPNQVFAKFSKELAAQGKYLTMPATFKPVSQRKIDTRAKLACETLLREADDMRITNDMKEELDLLVQCTDDGTVVDPSITLFKSVETGTCRIYLKETVPLSVYLMALVLKATFFVQVTEKAKTPASTFDKVSIKPYKGSASIQKRLAQPFGIEKAVEAQLEDNEDKLEQVAAYMHVLGPVSSFEACDSAFIEDQLEVIKKIFSGELEVVKQRNGGGGGSGGGKRGGRMAAETTAVAYLEEED